MKKVFILLLVTGIVLRFMVHFVFPSFNVDEIALGNNIKNCSFLELLYPLKNFQSSPPLYLILQKIIVSLSPFSFWISIKLLSFFSSVSGIILFYIFIKKNDYKALFLLLFVILLFNPFNIYNSLTVKQYTFDLTGILFLLVYFKTKTFQKYNWIFFVIWSLISNVGLFACAGYLMFIFFEENIFRSWKQLLHFFKKNIFTILAPFPYVIYFLWYMNQNGASELKIYMTNYWRSSFIPLDSGFFRYIMALLNEFSVYFLCAVNIWGLFLALIIVPIFYYFFKHNLLFRKELLLLFCVLSVHLTLNILHLYPFSDRLFLYLSPLLVLALGSSIHSIFGNNKFQFPFVILLSCTTFCMYSLYLPYKENDIVALYNSLTTHHAKTVYVTEKSNGCIIKFDDFTDNEFKPNITFIEMDTSFSKSNFIVSRVHKKMAYGKTSAEEIEIQTLLKQNKLILIEKLSGYNIYKINKFSQKNHLN